MLQLSRRPKWPRLHSLSQGLAVGLQYLDAVGLLCRFAAASQTGVRRQERWGHSRIPRTVLRTILSDDFASTLSSSPHIAFFGACEGFSVRNWPIWYLDRPEFSERNLQARELFATRPLPAASVITANISA